VVTSSTVYSTYYWGGIERPSLAFRFFLPALVILIPVVAWLIDRWNGRFRALLAFLVTTQVIWGVAASELGMREEGVALSRAKSIVGAAREVIPEGAVVVAPRALGETLEFEGKWSIVSRWLFPGAPARRTMLLPWEVPADLARRYADTPAPTQIERGADLRLHYRGLEGEALVSVVMADIHAWRANASVFWLGDPGVVVVTDSLMTDGRFAALGSVLNSPGSSVPPRSEESYWVP
jgi:hypothetical protein